MQQLRTSESHPIRIDTIDHSWKQSKGKLSLTFAPGKKQKFAQTGSWDRDLQKDIFRLKQLYHVNVIVCLLQEHQFKKLKIEKQLEECEKQVKDNWIPNNQNEYKKLAKIIVQQHLEKNENVVVHCMGGLGRAGTFAATCLIYNGFQPDNAIKMVRKARDGAINCQSQQKFLINLKFY